MNFQNFRKEFDLRVIFLFYIYIFSFITFSLLLHFNFWTMAFDLGIFDQGIWLASKFSDLFVTVRGLNKFGDHFDPIIYLLGSAYWIFDHISVMLIIHTVVIGLGVFPIYLYAKEKTQNDFFSLVISFCYLCYPALSNMNWDVIHPEAFAMTFTVYGFYFILKKKYIPFFIMAFLSILCKEDIALTYIFMGIYIFFKVDKKAGLVTSIFSIIWLILCMKVFIPFFNNADFFRFRAGWFADFFNNKFNFIWYIKTFSSIHNLYYILQLLVPILFLAVLDLPILMIATPAILVNILSNTNYLRSVFYHYNSMVTPFLFFALIYGVANNTNLLNYHINTKFLKRFKIEKIRILTTLLILSSIVSNIVLARVSFATIIPYNFYFISNLLNKESKPRAIIPALKMIPKEAPISSDYYILPHLSHRKKIYMFPNPFQECNWAIMGENTHNPNEIEYVIVDSYIIEDKYQWILKDLTTNGKFKLIYNKNRDDIGNISEKDFNFIMSTLNKNEKKLFQDNYYKNNSNYFINLNTNEDTRQELFRIIRYRLFFKERYNIMLLKRIL